MSIYDIFIWKKYLGILNSRSDLLDRLRLYHIVFKSHIQIRLYRSNNNIHIIKMTGKWLINGNIISRENNIELATRI